jgi:hypothetical protein
MRLKRQQGYSQKSLQFQAKELELSLRMLESQTHPLDRGLTQLATCFRKIMATVARKMDWSGRG